MIDHKAADDSERTSEGAKDRVVAFVIVFDVGS